MTNNYNNIPLEMRTYKQWVVWRFEDRDSTKPTKVPYSALSGKLASVTDPETWCSYEQAVYIATGTDTYDGLGFVLTQDDPYAFIDLDDAKGEPKAYETQRKIYEEFDSYSEMSPSGTGLHIIVKGELPSGRRRGCVEIYSNMRYMTMTGVVNKNMPINDHHDKINALYDQMSNGPSAAVYYAGATEATETDEAIIEKAKNALNGEKFSDLWEGNWQAHYHSQSEADFALVDIVAFYSDNKAQITRIFRASGLGKREKAQRQDYVNYMLNKCFDNKLPPVDIEGLQNQLNAAIEMKAAREAQQHDDVLEGRIDESTPELDTDFLTKKKDDKDVYKFPPGLLGELATYIYEQSPRPIKEIALTGAIGLMAGVCGRAFNVSGTGLNQYILLLAGTGMGKEAISQGIDKLITEVKTVCPTVYDFIGPSEISSPQAIIKHMNKDNNKSFVSQVGEFGIYLQLMCNPKAPAHMVGLRRFMLDAFNKSGYGRSIKPSITATKENNTDAIASPAFSILGESTPQKFYEGLHEGLMSEGFLPRFTIIEYSGKRPPFNKKFKNVKPSHQLQQRFVDLCATAHAHNGIGNAVDVHFTAEAEAILDKYGEHCDLNADSSDQDVIQQVWTRCHIKAMKLGALVAAGINANSPLIDADIATWAIDIVTKDANNMLTKFEAGEIGVDNDETKQLATITKLIGRCVTSPWEEVKGTFANDNMKILHDNKIIPYAYLQRKLSNVQVFRKDRLGGTRALQRAIDVLIARGDIKEISKPTLAKEYGFTCSAYMVSNLKPFKIGQ